MYYLKPTVHCNIHNLSFSDEVGNLRARPRTKHLAIRLHHFKEHVGRDVAIEKVSTDEQHGDIETKSLPSKKLSYHRFFVQGW